jgi:hypothetical protein
MDTYAYAKKGGLRKMPTKKLASIVPLVLWLSLAASAQCPGPNQNQAHCNGISVGAPKVFDNRSLTLMLESLNQTLAQQQQNYVDQKSVLNALSNVQGLSTSELSTNLQITGSPTPTRDISTQLNTGNVDANGKPLPNTFQRKTDVNTPGVTPAAPAPDTFASLPSGFNPTFGSSASDLLNDQVNLTYQIFNLRMILERALSDRLNHSECSNANHGLDCNATRLQSVLGFNVTIDPPRTANDAVAVVEITLTATPTASSTESPKQSIPVNPDEKRLSLVALMPQEKTYNAAALSAKSNAFGGSAVVHAFQIGGSVRKRSQVFYVYRDSDTISYERMSADPNTIIFGWMFRPVLGRKSVSPGLRQLFAITALPNVDCIPPKETPHDYRNCDLPKLNTSVHTYWKKYDYRTLTSYEERDANRAKKFQYLASFGLSHPQIFSDRRYENTVPYDGPTIYPTSEYQDDLSPRLTDVQWNLTGAKTVVVSARGNNFFTNTQVILGDKTFGKPEDGLILKSVQAFDLAATLDQLASAPASIIGRYGPAMPLLLTTFPEGLNQCGVELESVRTQPAISGTLAITIALQSQICSANSKQVEAAQAEEKKAADAVTVAQENHSQAVASNSPNSRRFEQELTQAHRTLENAQSDTAAAYANAHRLKWDDLPRQSLSLDKKTWQTPIVSVNGTALELPYNIAPSRSGGLSIQATMKEALLEEGGGVIKVTWPFYPLDKWTVTARYYPPKLAFPVTRISENSILISRINGLSFVHAPESEPSNDCWSLIAGDQAQKLVTPTCKVAAAPVPPKSKGKPAPPKKDDASGCPDPPKCQLKLPEPLPYTVTATVSKMPSHVILLAPNGTAYALDVPDLTEKKEDPKPTPLKQYDSQWIPITVPATKTVAYVKANGERLNFQLPSDDTKKKDSKTLSISVEITRAITSKPGTVDVTVWGHDTPKGNTPPKKDEQITKQQIAITCVQCSDKGDK